jgi:hypothetical protein
MMGSDEFADRPIGLKNPELKSGLQVQSRFASALIPLRHQSFAELFHCSGMASGEAC